jgi:serine protease Do
MGVCLVVAVTASGTPAQAQGSAVADTAIAVTDVLAALDRAAASVVGLQTRVSESAASANSLGRQREGSGVLIGEDGLVLTIGYLLLEAESVTLTLPGMRVVPARTVAYDIDTGFGLVKPLVPVSGLQPVPLGSASDLRQGQPLLAASGGAAGDVTTVQLVDQRPFSGSWEYHIEAALFTSPPLLASGMNHSGAGVFDSLGRLVGIGSLLMADVGGRGQRAPGNMFVPVDLLKPVLAELQTQGRSQRSRRPWLGLNSSEREGRVHVDRTAPRGPAQAAGVSAGDLVLAVDGQAVNSLESFYKAIWAKPSPETELELTVLQGASVKTLRIKPVDRMGTLQQPGAI